MEQVSIMEDKKDNKKEENKIVIKGLNKKIKGSPVLKDINLEFNGGKVYGLKGKNGSGKTMLMRAVSGLIIISTKYRRTY